MKRARLLLLALSLCGCEVVEGQPTAALGGLACARDLDCGAGRHCAEGACSLECTRDADCGLVAGPAEGSCSLCGRCVAPGQLDATCLPPEERPCTTDADCDGSLGSGYGCGALGTCVVRCGPEGACASGLVCTPGRNLCEEPCYSDGVCLLRGFARACRLPAGVDGATNELAAEPVVGQCAAAPDGLNFAKPGPNNESSIAYQGVWGTLFVSAVRTQGVPVLGRIDTAAIQLQLVKIAASGPDLQFSVRWCAARFLNFRENDLPLQQLVQIIVPQSNVAAIDVVNFRARGVPALAPGATFVTDEMVDLRGARLAAPATDPLPTRDDLTTQRDQDRDGHPGMTSLSTGLLTGELYQTQRTRAVLQASVVDSTHLHGLMATIPESVILGASVPELINDSEVSAHPQTDRSYFRAVRLDDAATCEQVISLGAAEVGWLAYTPHFDPAATP